MDYDPPPAVSPAHLGEDPVVARDRAVARYAVAQEVDRVHLGVVHVPRERLPDSSAASVLVPPPAPLLR